MIRLIVQYFIGSLIKINKPLTKFFCATYSCRVLESTDIIYKLSDYTFSAY